MKQGIYDSKGNRIGSYSIPDESESPVRSTTLLGALRHSAEAHRQMLKLLAKDPHRDAEERAALKARIVAIFDLLEIIDATEKRLAPNEQS